MPPPLIQYVDPLDGDTNAIQARDLKATVVMLILSMPLSSPNHPNRPSSSISIPAAHRESSLHPSELRKQVANAMLSIMPPTNPSAPKRPKLSLQTAIPPSPPTKKLSASLNISTDSPTGRNTLANTFEASYQTPSSPVQPHAPFPSQLSTSPPTNTSSTTSASSPLSHRAPYILPLGPHSILRNSPLPRRHRSATSTRGPKRMFPPVKRVAFKERLVEIVPNPVLEESADGDFNAELTEDEHQRRREEIQAEDGHATPVHSRRKPREWIWRPVDDYVLIQRDSSERPVRDESVLRRPSPILALEQSDSVRQEPP